MCTSAHALNGSTDIFWDGIILRVVLKLGYTVL